MIKFELSSLNGDYAKFRAEHDLEPDSSSYTKMTLWFSMQTHWWEKRNRPTEILISVEGL